MKTWFQSKDNPNTHALMDMRASESADGMPLLEPTLVGFILGGRGCIAKVSVFHQGETINIPVTKNMRVWEAKYAIEQTLKNLKP